MGVARDLVEELKASFREKDVWSMADCEKLCWLAGMKDEWKRADGENFEAVCTRQLTNLVLKFKEW